MRRRRGGAVCDRSAAPSTISGIERLIVGLGVAAGIWWAVIAWADTPVVQKAWPTEACVAVIPDSAGSCDNLPEKYTVEYVRPK